MLEREALRFRDRLGLPALGVASLESNGDVIVSVVGTTSRDGREQAKVDDRWHIGSCCKSLTSLLYARLVELGQAEWGARLPDLLPDLAHGIDASWGDVTVDGLLLCRSGMKANLNLERMKAGWEDDREPVEQRAEATRWALTDPPRRPGRFVYSNLGYIVVGAIIDRIAGMSYEEALFHHILQPLSVTSAGFGPPDRLLGHGPRVALGSLALGRGAAADPALPRSDNPLVMNPAGRLHLDLNDWARIVRVFVSQGGGLVQPESVERLLRSPDGKSMSMGWAPTRGVDGASHGMQGSNMRWSATVMLGSELDRAVLVATNDGRTRVLTQTARFAAGLLK